MIILHGLYLTVLCNCVLVLDEVTSALSEDAEEMLYSKLTDLGITFLSIGQRSSLKKVMQV